MKNKILKKIYLGLIIISVLIGFYLVIRPLKRDVQIGHYDVKKNLELKTYGSQVEEIITVENTSTYKILFYIEEKKHDNLNVSLYSLNNNKEIFNVFVKSYESDSMFFEFIPLKKGKYKLIIKDKDDDPLRLYTGNSVDKNYINGDEKNTIKLITYYKENNYFYLWYPIFVIAFLITIYPFVWGDKNEK